jgi:hypothetical protein
MWTQCAKPRPETVKRAARLIQDGQFHDAAEILSGGVHGGSYDPAYYELLGQALLGIGRQELAGRFLFLSGVRKPEYESAIALFIRRNAGDHFRAIHSKFTFETRTMWRIDRFPQQLADDLRKLGFPENIQEEYFVKIRRARLPSGFRRRGFPIRVRRREQPSGGVLAWLGRLFRRK